MEGKWGGREEYINLLSRVPLVVLDDFDTERDTKYMQEIVYDVINARYTAGLPLIVTTNLTLEQLARPESVNEQRIYGRLLEMCYPIEVKGRNKRQDKMMDTYAPMRDILGV
jgi:DNA replication protein DnaC